MSLRFCVLHISTLCVAVGFAASPAHAQARVGEAAVVKNEVVRVMGSASSQISVGDGVLRDEIVSNSTAPFSTMSTPIAISRSG